jgi:5-methylcytosine-specific restriction endonuclease McrA
MNGRAGKPDRRPGAPDRRRMQMWMMHKYGNGTQVDCTHCGRELTSEEAERDRIVPGGPYNRSNVQPSCRPCNIRRGDSPVTPYPVAG